MLPESRRHTVFAVFSDILAELWAETAEQPGLGAPTMKSWEGYRELRISISRDDSGLHPPIYIHLKPLLKAVRQNWQTGKHSLQMKMQSTFGWMLRIRSLPIPYK